MARPRKYDTAEEIQERIDEYFALCEAKEKPPTITGLCLHLDFSDRASFYDYEKNGEFSHTIKKARTRIESVYESNLHGPSATGSIFALKNFGWRDKVEQEITGTGGGPVQWIVDVRDSQDSTG